MKKLDDKIVWLTGASSGIGEALAYTLNKEGVNLIISARREQELERVKKASDFPDKVKVLPLDLANQETLASSTAKAISLFGRIDILINNGGISQRSLAKDTLLLVDRKIMEVNFFGAITLTKHLLTHMIEHGGGHFINVSSLVGKFGTPYRSTYAASKHALHGFYDSLRAELWEKGIKVTMVCPGFIKTNVSINAMTGSGNRLNEMDQAQANGMEPMVCAKKIIKAIKKEKQEVYIGGKEKYAVYLKRFLPSIFSHIVKKATVR